MLLWALCTNCFKIHCIRDGAPRPWGLCCISCPEGCLMSDFSVTYKRTRFVYVKISQVKMHWLQTYVSLHLPLLESPTGWPPLCFPFWFTRLSSCSTVGSESTPGREVPFWNQSVAHRWIKHITSHLWSVHRGRDLVKDHPQLFLLRICLKTLGYCSSV